MYMCMCVCATNFPAKPKTSETRQEVAALDAAIGDTARREAHAKTAMFLDWINKLAF